MPKRQTSNINPVTSVHDLTSELPVPIPPSTPPLANTSPPVPEKREDYGRSMSRRLRTIMDAHDYDPLKELIEIAQDPDTCTEDRITVNKELLKYAYPTMKSVDFSEQAQDKGVTVNVIRFSGPGQDTQSSGSVTPESSDEVQIIEQDKIIRIKSFEEKPHENGVQE